MHIAQTGFNPEYSEDAPTLEQVSAISGSTILEFGTPWCPHCQAASLLIEKVFSAYPQLPHVKLLDGKGVPLGRAFKVKLWPTLILLRDGEEIDRLVRPTVASDIEHLLEQSVKR